MVLVGTLAFFFGPGGIGTTDDTSSKAWASPCMHYDPVTRLQYGTPALLVGMGGVFAGSPVDVEYDVSAPRNVQNT